MREKSEYDHKLVDLARVARIVAGGKRFRFRATVVLGNKNGKIGAGIAKGVDVADAISKATTQARKKIISVSLVDGTIPHEIEARQDAAYVFLKPAKVGTGIIAGGAIRSVLELAGVKNILSKMKGSNNKINNVFATIKALSLLKRLEEFADARGKKLEDMIPKKRAILKTKVEALKAIVDTKTTLKKQENAKPEKPKKLQAKS